MTRPPLSVRPSGRRRSTASFRAGSPIPTSLFDSRRSSGYYHTFPTPRLSTPRESLDLPRGEHHVSPLPVRQLLLLALLSFAEQTALNSISPYIPSMIVGFPGIKPEDVGLYVGILASAFAVAQLTTNLFWGFLSDRYGRKPILLAGSFLLAACFMLFGFCTTYWQALVVHVAMGLLNGNAAIVPSALGDLTDRSNQSTAFTWLPIIYSLGGLSGPALGGLLVGVGSDRYPHAVCNIVVGTILAASAVLVGIWLEETHPQHEHLGPDIDKVWKRLRHLQEDCAAEPLIGTPKARSDRHAESADDERSAETPQISIISATASRADDDDDDYDDDALSTHSDAKPHWREVLNRSTLVLLATYLIYQLANISFNSLYPIFAAGPSPAGRDLEPAVIGLSLSASGLFTILFQAFLFRPIKSRLGNLRLYRYALLGLAVSMCAMPWVGYLDSAPLFGVGSGRVWLYLELGAVLIAKNISAVGGLSCVMLLINNSATSDKVLGTLNGIAQTISALGRSVGPFLSGGLFTLSSRVEPKGELIAWGVFGGIAVVGYFGTMAIDGERLESDDWDGEEGGGEGEAGGLEGFEQDYGWEERGERNGEV